VLEVKTYYMQV